MNTLAAIIVLTFCFAAMGIGFLISKKVLRRGCSTDPDSCACAKEGKDPASCDK